MSDPYAHGMPEGDFHSWVKPTAPDCPNCGCCSARLCERGRKHVVGCRAAVGTPEEQNIVRNCPCSAETTEGTEAHRAAQRRDAQRQESAGATTIGAS